MPIDPNIPLQAGNVGQGGFPGFDFGTNLQNAQQLLQFRDAQQQFRNQNALKGILSQPGAIGPDGNPTEAAMQQVMGVDPNYGMKLRQNALVQQEHQLKMSAMKTDVWQQKLGIMNDKYGEVDKAYKDAIAGGKTPEIAQQLAQDELDRTNQELSQGGSLSETEQRNLPTRFDPIAFQRFFDGSKQIQTGLKTQAELDRQKRTDERLEYDKPVEMQWTDNDGKAHREMLQYDKSPGGGWVTADGKREKVPFQVTPYKAPAPGSVAETRSAIADDVAADPAFKDKPPGLRAQEVETRLKIAQGQLASQDVQKEIAKGIAGYELAPLSAYSMTKSGSSGGQIMADVLKLNPNYQAGRYNEVNKAMQAFGTGKQGDTVRSINVAVQHLGVLQQAAEALKNHDVRLFNRIGNDIAAWTGQPAPTTFDGLKRVVGTEVEKAVAGGVGAVVDREDLLKSLSRDNSEEQLIGPNGTIAGFKKLLAGQAQGLKHQYEDATGFTDSSPFGFNKKLMPDTSKELGLLEQKDGVKDGGGNPSASPKFDALSSDKRERALTYLRAHPETAPQFEKTFELSPGSAAKLLGDQKKAASGSSQPAAAPAQPASAYQEGATGTNRKTGERWIFKGGKWVPLAAAPSAPTN